MGAVDEAAVHVPDAAKRTRIPVHLAERRHRIAMGDTSSWFPWVGSNHVSLDSLSPE